VNRVPYVPLVVFLVGLAVSQALRYRRTRKPWNLVASGVCLASAGVSVVFVLELSRPRPQLDLVNASGVPIVVRHDDWERKVEPKSSLSFRYGLGESFTVGVRDGAHPRSFPLPNGPDRHVIRVEARLGASGEVEIPDLTGGPSVDEYEVDIEPGSEVPPTPR